MPSFKTPTSKQINAALQRMHSPEFSAYFLARLDNPKWIGPLRSADLFENPPPAIDLDGGGLRYPHWPPSKYLARMAELDPIAVSEIFSSIETDNGSILTDVLKAALVMPVETAATLVPVVCRAAESVNLWIGFKEASELCVRLADGGQVNAAIDLTTSLFEPRVEAEEKKQSRRDDYWYEEGLRKVSPALARAKPNEILPLLCDWLEKIVEQRGFIDEESGNDFSYSWRPSIADHEQNSGSGAAGEMVGFVRQAFEEAIRSDALSLDGALAILDQHSYLVFKRLRLLLITEFAKSNEELARSEMLNEGYLDDYEYRNEYAMLLGSGFPLLSQMQKKEWFDRIEAGPDMTGFDERIEESKGRRATDDDRQSRFEYWQMEKLHWIRTHLEGQWLDTYQRILAEKGEPEFAYFISSSTIRSGHDSPMTVDSLLAMTFAGAVKAVATWRPAENADPWGPNVEGLASIFNQYVAKNPAAFSKEALVLQGQPSIFVRGFLSKMIGAVTENVEIDLNCVLGLCEWVIDQPEEESTTYREEHDPLVDPDWRWARNEISRLVEAVCVARERDVPRFAMDGLRARLWGLLEKLYQGKMDSYIVKDYADEDPRLRDYLDRGINSDRGKAVEAGLEYARWIANHIKTGEEKREVIPDGLGAMPEVREMLEWQIVSENRSVEALSVIGSRIGLINWIDQDWLVKHASDLFRLEGINETPQIVDGWAAWNAFLVWVQPHEAFYRALKSQFAFAIEQAAKVQDPKNSSMQPMHRLGEHLMILHGRGDLLAPDDSELLQKFLATANPDIRRHGIGFVGRSIRSDETLPPDIIKRFMSLWSLYWKGHGKADARQNPRAHLFGEWFATGQFPNQWALDRLEEFTVVVAVPEPDHGVIETLEKIADTDLGKSVQILQRMVVGDRDGWNIHGWIDPAKSILMQAMCSEGATRDTAIEVINHLGRRGMTEFGELLKD